MLALAAIQPALTICALIYFVELLYRDFYSKFCIPYREKNGKMFPGSTIPSQTKLLKPITVCKNTLSKRSRGALFHFKKLLKPVTVFENTLSMRTLIDFHVKKP